MNTDASIVSNTNTTVNPYPGGSKDRKWKTAIAVSFAVAAVCLAVSLLYHLFNYQKNPEGICLRTLPEMAALVLGMLLLPTSLFTGILFSLIYIKKKKGVRFKLGAFIALTAVSGFLYAVYLVTAGAYVLFSLVFAENERIDEEGWLVGSDMAGMTYYEEHTWLWKKKYEPVTAGVRYEMEKWLGVDISSVTPEDAEGFQVYEMYTETEPQIIFHVLPNPYRGFQDDYTQAKTNGMTAALVSARSPGRHVQEIKKSFRGTDEWAESISIECLGWQDMEDCARLTAGIIETLLEDSWYENASAIITIHCNGTDPLVSDVIFPFGQGGDGDIYTDWSLVYNRLLENYMQNAVDKEKTEESGKMDYETSAFFVEGAYKALYEELFPRYPYKPTYNAKGNFYAYLTEGTGTLQSVEGTFNTLETVVYDRQSANGKCHLFVHYREYYQTGTDTPYTTEIVDMYAVDMETGTVYVSGRRAWEDLGTEAYREATGEP